MSFDELFEHGRKMSEADIKANLVSLTSDPRFAAVFGLLERRRSRFTRAVCNPALAGKPGDLTHVAGGLNETLNLLDSLKQVLEPPAERGAQPPEE